MTGQVLFAIFLIFAGAAVLSTLSLMTRQSILVANILLGIALGPWALGFFKDSVLIGEVGDLGIVFLLFLLGLNLPITKLLHMIRKVTTVGVVSSLVFCAVGMLVAWGSGFNVQDAALIGAAVMFSSTIIGIKLLPTNVLHHQHTGGVMISVLLFQDLLAILTLLILQGISDVHVQWVRNLIFLIIGLPILAGIGFVADRYILKYLFARFNRIKEYLFLVAIAWCLAMAQLAAVMGFSTTIGAFIAGVSLASTPVALYISESLKPVRDFFLVMYFFAVGASFNLTYVPHVIVPALILVMLLTLVKPYTFAWLFRRVGEMPYVSWEAGVRLAQMSEFALIIAYSGMTLHVISMKAGYLIEAVTILSFIVSSYWVVWRYPTPVAISDRLRRD